MLPPPTRLTLTTLSAYNTIRYVLSRHIYCIINNNNNNNNNNIWIVCVFVYASGVSSAGNTQNSQNCDATKELSAGPLRGKTATHRHL